MDIKEELQVYFNKQDEKQVTADARAARIDADVDAAFSGAVLPAISEFSAALKEHGRHIQADESGKPGWPCATLRVQHEGQVELVLTVRRAADSKLAGCFETLVSDRGQHDVTQSPPGSSREASKLTKDDVLRHLMRRYTKVL